MSQASGTIGWGQLKTDNFEGSGTPLIHFKGRLIQRSIEQRKGEDKNTGRSWESLGVEFTFGDLTVIDSREPYTLPIAKIRVPYTDRDDTRWSVWAKSFTALVPVELRPADDPYKALDNKMQEWQYRFGNIRGPLKLPDGTDDVGADGKVKWGVTPTECWQINAIEGMASASADLTQELIDFIGGGKTDQEVYNAVYNTMTWKSMAGYSAVLESVGDRKLFSTLMAGGKIRQEASGLYVKV